MTIRCPICPYDGYLILEKPRKLNRSKPTNWQIWQKAREKYPNLKDWEIKLKLGLNESSNIAYTEYELKDRPRSPHYKIVHNVWRFNSKFHWRVTKSCYLGSLRYALTVLKLIYARQNKLDKVEYYNALRKKYPENKKPNQKDAKKIYNIILLAKKLENKEKLDKLKTKKGKKARVLVSDPTIKNPKS